ncbi:MAG: Fe-S cluster assembly protein HesB [Planctomycetota bacterium]
MNTRIEIPHRDEFSLAATIRSHGWSNLGPFRTDDAGERLTVHMDLDGPVRAEVIAGRGALAVTADSTGPISESRLVDTLRSCLRMDLDLEPFWNLCADDPALAWVAEQRAGRILRAPTAFADATMILATTNCSWALTRKMAAQLIRHWGVGGAFPQRERLARVRADTLRARASMGYRAPHLAAIARGECMEAWRASEAPTDELFQRALALPGFGPYAAGHLLRSFGRFDYLCIDSMIRSRWTKQFPRRQPTESAISKHLTRYGEWMGLALWMTVTEQWYRREAWHVGA